MVRFRLSTFVAAPVEEVYEYVTAHGKNGPTSDEAFRREYGTVVERDGNVFLITEDVRRYPEDEPDLISWRCTFSYPESRAMEAIDSTWAHRYDSFVSTGGGTQWSVQWHLPSGWVKSITQSLVFRLRGHRSMRRKILDPVREHFEAIYPERESPPA